MKQSDTGNHSSLYKYSLLYALIWTLVLAGLFYMNLRSELRQAVELAAYQARAFFQEIVTTRQWNADHGGVYVPVTKRVQPNPYLDVPDRDITTTDGKKLTKINPAYMTRQIGEIASKRNKVWFHITSTNPIRPANIPDSWEASALVSFKKGISEYFEFINPPNETKTKTFRYMAPLWVERPCLKCHAKQGYKEGDLRGGISVSIDAEPIMATRVREIRNLIFAYVVIWVLGLIGLWIGARGLRVREKEKELLIQELRESLSEIKTLSGLLPICASCKKIRDDKGYWNQIESYITDRSDAQFSHGICPECARKLYPEIYDANEKG